MCPLASCMFLERCLFKSSAHLAFNFNWVPFVYFYYSGRWVKKDLAMMYVIECFKFSSKSFILAHLTFRFLIHFEFIFMHGVRECFSFILLHVAVQFSQHHLLKRLSFLHSIFLPPFYRLIDHRCVALFLVFPSCSIDQCLSLCQYHTVLFTVAL